MAQTEPTTRDRILEAAYRLFYRAGFTRVSVDEIADLAGVTKRTVYYHFKSKDDIAAAALQAPHEHLMRQFRKWIGPEYPGPCGMVENLFAELKVWADGENWLGSGFSRISAELADMPGHPARHAAHAHKARVESWLRDTFDVVGLADAADLAKQVMTLLEGSMSLSLIHGETGYILSAGDAAVQIVRNRLPG